MVVGEYGPLIKVESLREELDKISDPAVPKQLLDFIDYLLVVDKDARPSVYEALKHEYFDSSRERKFPA